MFQKTCKICQTPKPLGDFFRNKNMPDGYLNQCKVCRSERDRTRYIANAEVVKELARNYRKANPEKQKEYNRRRRAEIKASPIMRVIQEEYMREYRRENATTVQQYNRKWAAKNRDKYLAYRRNKERQRRHRKVENGGSFTHEEWITLCSQFGNRCVDCMETKALTVDHIVPSSKGGTSDISNIQPLCAECNGRKHNRIIIDFRLPWKTDHEFTAINGKHYSI